jgi:hypothetical protein
MGKWKIIHACPWDIRTRAQRMDSGRCQFWALSLALVLNRNSAKDPLAVFVSHADIASWNILLMKVAGLT